MLNSESTTAASTWLRRGTLAVIVFAMMLRLGVAWALRNAEPAPDAVEDYFPIAQNVLSGAGFLNSAGEPDIVRGPVYPLFVAVTQLVSTKSLLPLLVLQGIVDTVTCWLIVVVSRRLFGPGVAICGALLYALNPLAIYACGLTVPETLFTALFAGACACFLRAIDNGDFKRSISQSSSGIWSWMKAPATLWMVATGVLLGLASLCRSTPLLLVAPWALIAWWRMRGFAGVRQGFILAFACGAVILPWTIRNAAVFHEFIPIVANGGSNLYAGSERAFWAPPPRHHGFRQARYNQLVNDGWIAARPENVGPGAGDKYNASLALVNYRRQWQKDAADVVKFQGEKFSRLWYASQSGRGQVGVGAVNLTMLLFALWGFTMAWIAIPARRVELLACGGSVLYFALVLSLLFPQARYVIGFTPLLATLASPAVALAVAFAWSLRSKFSFSPKGTEFAAASQQG